MRPCPTVSATSKFWNISQWNK